VESDSDQRRANLEAHGIVLWSIDVLEDPERNLCAVKQVRGTSENKHQDAHVGKRLHCMMPLYPQNGKTLLFRTMVGISMEICNSSLTSFSKLGS